MAAVIFLALEFSLMVLFFMLYTLGGGLCRTF